MPNFLKFNMSGGRNQKLGDLNYPDVKLAKGINFQMTHGYRDIPAINDDRSRRHFILKDKPAVFPISDNDQATSNRRWYEFGSVGNDAVYNHDALIRKIAREENVNADLLRSIIHVENARAGHYGKVSETLGMSDSLLPMNIRKSLWLSLSKKGDLSNAEENIRAGAILLKRTQRRVNNPTVAKVATLWNSGGRNTVNDFGARVAKIYDKKPWMNDASMDTYGMFP